MACGVWLEILDEHRIPLEAYEPLRQAAHDFRAFKMRSGASCPDMTPDLFVAYLLT
jgi:hypothetical protein